MLENDEEYILYQMSDYCYYDRDRTGQYTIIQRKIIVSTADLFMNKLKYLTSHTKNEKNKTNFLFYAFCY